MNDKQNKVLLGAVAFIAIVALVLSWKDKTPSLSVSSPDAVHYVNYGANGAAVVGNAITVNGVTTWTLRQELPRQGTASTTLCSFPNPTGAATTTTATGAAFDRAYPGTATSTLLSLSVQITRGTTTALVFSASTSTDAYATSTNFFFYDTSVASGAAFSGSWRFGGMSTSSDVRLNASFPVSLGDNYRVGPAQFVNIKSAGAGLSGYSFGPDSSTSGGQCIAEFRSYNAI